LTPREVLALRAVFTSASTPVDHAVSRRGYPMVRVPAGSFTMGSTKGDSDEQPVHTVRLSRSFWMGESEVTQGLWQEVMGSNPSYFSSCGSDCPVEKVSWYDVVSFANALSRSAGLEECYEIRGTNVSWPRGLNCGGYRLPTEAEWEYAARAGQDFEYAGSNNLDEVAWYDGNSGGETHPVGQKRPNAWGLYDMSGNVFEWVNDWYDDEYYSSKSHNDPYGPESSVNRVNRVLRGGSWSYGARDARVAVRSWYGPAYRYSAIGFRLVLPVAPAGS
jgi:formylglycine-generating enzyme required for sulfatase activity